MRTRIAASAALLAALSSVSVVLGFLRDVLIASIYGASAAIDAYLVAQGVMNLALALAASAVAKTVIPVVAPAIAAGDVAAAHRSVATALAISLAVLGLVAVVIGVFAGTTVQVLAPGFDEPTSAVAATLTRIVLVATVLITATNVLAAIAQSHRRFFWAGAQGIPFNVVMIVAAAVFGPRYGVVALAVGFVVGSAVRLLVQLVPLWQLRITLMPHADLGDPRLRTMAAMIPPLLVGSAVGNVNTLVDRAVASSLEPGAIASLSFGWRIVSLADTVAVASLVAALYPAFGAVSGADARPVLRRLVNRGLGAVTLITVPASVVLAVAPSLVVVVVYGRGNFVQEDVTRTATAVAWYSLALAPLAWREVTTRAFYALADTRAPAGLAILAVATNVAGDVTLGLTFGIPGVAASTVISFVVAAATGTALLAYKHRAVDAGAAAWSIARLAAAGLLAAVAGIATMAVLDGVLGGAPLSSGLAAAGRLALVVGAVGGLYAIALIGLRAPELIVVSDTVRAATSRLRPRRSVRGANG